MNKNTIKCMVCDKHHIAGESHDCLKYTEADLAAKQVELLREIQDAVLFGLDVKEPLSSILDIIQDKITKLENK